MPQSLMPDFVEKARADASRMGQAASDFAASSFTIPDQLRKAVQEALDYNKDVISKRSEAFTNMTKAPADAEARFGVQNFTTGDQAGQANPNYIFNPFERNKAISDYIGNAEVPFNTWNKVLGLREGTIADTVNAGTNAFKAQATAAQAAAEAAQKAYENTLDEFRVGADLKYKYDSMAQDRELKMMDLGQKNKKNSLSGLTSLLAQGLGDGSLTDFMTPENALMMMAMDPENKDFYTTALGVADKGRKKTDANQSIQTITSTLDNFLKRFKETSLIGRVSPLSEKGAELESFKNILTNVIAKEIEAGRLSDQDRAFYLNQMPSPWMPYNIAQARINGIKMGLSGRLKGKLMLKNPKDGKVYEMDNQKEYDSYLKKGYVQY